MIILLSLTAMAGTFTDTFGGASNWLTLEEETVLTVFEVDHPVTIHSVEAELAENVSYPPSVYVGLWVRDGTPGAWPSDYTFLATDIDRHTVAGPSFLWYSEPVEVHVDAGQQIALGTYCYRRYLTRYDPSVVSTDPAWGRILGDLAESGGTTVNVASLSGTGQYSLRVTATIDDTDEDGFDASEDCDDFEAATYPGAADVWYDGVDSDCAGDNDNDADLDGYESAAHGGDDCDDDDADVSPAATETWYDGVDTDCDGASDYDADGDGYDSDAHGGDDCNDASSSVRPGASDTWYDGVDSNCDGLSDNDADGDGYDSDAHGGDDCDDTDPAFSPGVEETWYDGVDNDCDGGNDYDADGDGHVVADVGGDDCDDSNPDVWEADDPECGEGGDDGGDDDDDDSDDDSDDKGGCSHTGAGPGGGPLGLGLLLLAATLQRRRRA